MTGGRADRAALADEVRSLVADVNRLAPTNDAVAEARSLVAAARQALDGP